MNPKPFARRIAALATALLLALGTHTLVQAETPAPRQGTATVVALNANGSGALSMMAPLLAATATLNEDAAGVAATITFTSGEIQPPFGGPVAVPASALSDLKTYAADETERPAEVLSSTDDELKVRVPLVALESDTKLGLSYSLSGRTSNTTVLLHFSDAQWIEPPVEPPVDPPAPDAQTGYATVQVWHESRDQDSMMAPLLKSDAQLATTTDGTFYATITFQKGSIMGVAVNADSIANVRTLPGGQETAATDGTKNAEEYVVRVRIDDPATTNTTIKMNAMGGDKTARLHFSAVTWVDPNVDPKTVLPPVITGKHTVAYKGSIQLQSSQAGTVWGGSNDFVHVCPDGKVESKGHFWKTGSATITATANGKTTKHTVQVEPTWQQWLLLTLGFGWIWM